MTLSEGKGVIAVLGHKPQQRQRIGSYMRKLSEEKLACVCRLALGGTVHEEEAVNVAGQVRVEVPACSARAVAVGKLWISKEVSTRCWHQLGIGPATKSPARHRHVIGTSAGIAIWASARLYTARHVPNIQDHLIVALAPWFANSIRQVRRAMRFAVTPQVRGVRAERAILAPLRMHK